MKKDGARCARWTPTSYRWPYKWVSGCKWGYKPYKWSYGPLLITGRVSLCGVVVLDALGGLDEHLNVKSWMVFH